MACLGILGAFLASAIAAGAPLCPGIELVAPLEPPLTGNERRLVCGDPSGTDGKSEGWKRIPKTQAIFVLRGFLQSRGYLTPKFEDTPDGGARVDPGSIARVRSLRAVGGPASLDVSRKRGFAGEPLAPRLLDSIESWVRHELGREGYPCATVRAESDLKEGADSGDIVVRVDEGRRFSIRSFQLVGLKEGDESLDPEVLRRYDPFRIGDPYDEIRLAISADRAISDGVVERAFFAPLCDSADTVRQEVSLGESRIFTAGFALNTEELSVLQASLKRVRIGRNASSATLRARASIKVQQLTALLDWRFAAPSSPSALQPRIELRHDDERPFEIFSERVQLGYVRQLDFPGVGLGVLVGPRITAFQATRGDGAARAQELALALELRVSSHGYEFNRTLRSSGFRATLEGDWGARELVSSFGAARARARAEGVWSLGGYEPPIVVLSARGGYSVTAPQAGPGRLDTLPPSYPQFLGGIADLRGFGRMELPAAPVGGLSGAFLGLEVRPALFGEKLEPMVFVDAGGIGLRSYFPESPLFWSPGIGLHWNSPVGSVRSTLAHGFVSGGAPASLSHWQFYLSLGEPL